MVKMMVTVVIVFTVCWLPFNILNVSNNSYFSILKKCSYSNKEIKKINLILIVIIIIN